MKRESPTIFAIAFAVAVGCVWWINARDIDISLAAVFGTAGMWGLILLISRKRKTGEQR